MNCLFLSFIFFFFFFFLQVLIFFSWLYQLLLFWENFKAQYYSQLPCPGGSVFDTIISPHGFRFVPSEMSYCAYCRVSMTHLIFFFFNGRKRVFFSASWTDHPRVSLCYGCPFNETKHTLEFSSTWGRRRA